MAWRSSRYTIAAEARLEILQLRVSMVYKVAREQSGIIHLSVFNHVVSRMAWDHRQNLSLPTPFTSTECVSLGILELRLTPSPCACANCKIESSLHGTLQVPSSRLIPRNGDPDCPLRRATQVLRELARLSRPPRIPPHPLESFLGA